MNQGRINKRVALFGKIFWGFTHRIKMKGQLIVFCSIIVNFFLGHFEEESDAL